MVCKTKTWNKGGNHRSESSSSIISERFNLTKCLQQTYNNPLTLFGCVCVCTAGDKKYLVRFCVNHKEGDVNAFLLIYSLNLDSCWFCYYRSCCCCLWWRLKEKLVTAILKQRNIFSVKFITSEYNRKGTRKWGGGVYPTATDDGCIYTHMISML